MDDEKDKDELVDGGSCDCDGGCCPRETEGLLVAMVNVCGRMIDVEGEEEEPSREFTRKNGLTLPDEDIDT